MKKNRVKKALGLNSDDILASQVVPFNKDFVATLSHIDREVKMQNVHNNELLNIRVSEGPDSTLLKGMKYLLPFNV